MVPRTGSMTWEYSRSDPSYFQPALARKKKKKKSPWLGRHPPLTREINLRLAKHFLYKLSALRAVYPSAILNRPNKNFPVEFKTELGAEGNSLSQLDWKNAKPWAFWSEITVSDSNGFYDPSQLSGLEAAAFWVNEKPEIFMIANNNI